MFEHADAYDRFMGRYSTLLAPQMADLAGVTSSQRVLDVGCGPGALVAELVARVGAEHVSAVDPSAPFVEAARHRFPGVDVRVASAEALPFADGAFDAALAQLVVHFMADAVAGVREMARVTRRGGAVVACVWDIDGGSPLTPFWQAVREIDPSATGEAWRPGTREGDLVRIFSNAGVHVVRASVVTATLRHETFEDWWAPFELGVGPAGAYLAALDPATRTAIRERAGALVPVPFVHAVRAWAARGRA